MKDMTKNERNEIKELMKDMEMDEKEHMSEKDKMMMNGMYEKMEK